MNIQSLQLLFPVLIVTLVASQVFFLYLISKALQDRQKEIDKEERVIKETTRQSADVLRKAVADAGNLVTQAQHKSTDIVSQQQQSGAQLAAVFEAHLNDIEKSLKAQFDINAKTADSAYKEFIKVVEESISQQIQKNNAMLGEKSNQMIQATQDLMSKFITDVQGKVTTQIDQELKAVREEITQYKLHRMQVIDERILEILEEIIQIALEKRLSLAEQSELVYRALEEAKRENAFGK